MLTSSIKKERGRENAPRRALALRVHRRETHAGDSMVNPAPGPARTGFACVVLSGSSDPAARSFVNQSFWARIRCRTKFWRRHLSAVVLTLLRAQAHLPATNLHRWMLRPSRRSCRVRGAKACFASRGASSSQADDIRAHRQQNGDADRDNDQEEFSHCSASGSFQRGAAEIVLRRKANPPRIRAGRSCPARGHQQTVTRAL